MRDLWLKKTVGWALALFAFGAICLLIDQLRDFCRLADEIASPLGPQLSAGIFARPLELYPGKKLTLKDLDLELDLLNYHRKRAIDGAGSFTQTHQEFTIFGREFYFDNGFRPSRIIRLNIRKKRIVSLFDSQTKEPLDRFFLEPLCIGHISSSKQNAYLPIDRMPQLLIKTLLTVEDRRFFAHRGIDGAAVFRAGFSNFFKKRGRQGGSTLTQQLARNLFFSNQYSLGRKFNEMLMALIMEVKLSKKQILELYLNRVYLGQHGDRSIRGVKEASGYYFNRDIKDLSPAQTALIIGLLKGPSYYDPVRFHQRALARRNLVLKIMAENHLISDLQLHEARSTPLKLKKHYHRPAIYFPTVVDLVKRELKEDFFQAEKESGMANLRIFTTCDPVIQLKTEKAAVTGLKTLEAENGLAPNSLETATVVLSPDGEKMLALVGGRRVRFRGFNRALDARRPIGSLIKPVYFLAALARPEKYNLMTLLNDAPVRVSLNDGNMWQPKNFNGIYNGPIPLQEVLSRSYNAASVRLGLDLGLGDLQKTIHRLGCSSKTDLYPSALVGSIFLSPLKLAEIYAVFSSGGVHIPVKIIRSICRRDGSLLLRRKRSSKRVFDAAPVYLLDTALQKVISEGSAAKNATPFTIRLKAAGKTGTTNDLRDSWFAGFTGDILALVWIGRDDNQSSRLTGADGAFKIWQNIISVTSENSFAPEKPANVTWLAVDPNTGLKVDDVHCDKAVLSAFITGYEPKKNISCSELEKRARTPFNQWLKETLR